VKIVSLFALNWKSKNLFLSGVTVPAPPSLRPCPRRWRFTWRTISRWNAILPPTPPASKRWRNRPTVVTTRVRKQLQIRQSRPVENWPRPKPQKPVSKPGKLFFPKPGKSDLRLGSNKSGERDRSVRLSKLLNANCRISIWRKFWVPGIRFLQEIRLKPEVLVTRRCQRRGDPGRGEELVSLKLPCNLKSNYHGLFLTWIWGFYSICAYVRLNKRKTIIALHRTYLIDVVNHLCLVLMCLEKHEISSEFLVSRCNFFSKHS